MLRRIITQVVIVIVVFQLVSFLKETSMLSTNTPLNDITATQPKVDINNIPTLRGNTVSLNAEGKTTVLYFFAPWCQICHVSIGNLQSLFEKNQDINVVAIALDYSNTKELLQFTSQHQLTFPVALGNETIKDTFEITAYPSYYVLNKDNVIVGKSMGYSSKLGLYLRSL